MNDLTVCITNFKRAKYLRRAIDSVLNNGIKNIVVSTMEPDHDVEKVMSDFSDIKFVRLDDDLGCNELWLQAVYRSTTDRVIVLHDDDLLGPEFGEAYASIIKPQMDSGQVQFCSWRAHLYHDNGTIQPTEWHRSATGRYPSGVLRDFMLRPGRLSLSPIVSILNRNVLIDALKEAHKYLTPNEKCLYHPGMLLGTEIIAYLRHCADLPKWMFVDMVLSYYGCCESSGTVKAQKSGDLRPLIEGYDVARNHFRSGAFAEVVKDPKVVFIYDDVSARNQDEQRRFNYAMHTWKYHFNQGDILEFPTKTDKWKRNSSDLGDKSPVPYFKDIIDYGYSMSRPEDIIVYANRDICLTTGAPERIIQAAQSRGVAVAWRRNFIPKVGRLYKHSTMAKRDGGVDLVAITPKWWAQHRDKMPDMFIGRECWDWCFRIICQETNGKDVYADDIVYHEPHESWWKKHKKTNPAQLHNRSLARVFFARRRDRLALSALQ